MSLKYSMFDPIVEQNSMTTAMKCVVYSTSTTGERYNRPELLNHTEQLWRKSNPNFDWTKSMPHDVKRLSSKWMVQLSSSCSLLAEKSSDKLKPQFWTTHCEAWTCPGCSWRIKIQSLVLPHVGDCPTTQRKQIQSTSACLLLAGILRWHQS